MMLTGEALLVAIDTAIDAAVHDGRIRVRKSDPNLRELARRVYAMGAPMHMPPPREPAPVMTAVLVMDSGTLWDLVLFCRAYGEIGLRCEYAGVPIKVDESAGGRVYLVSLAAMQGAA